MQIKPTGFFSFVEFTAFVLLENYQCTVLCTGFFSFFEITGYWVLGSSVSLRLLGLSCLKNSWNSRFGWLKSHIWNVLGV